jgi:hypothetical protein
LFLKIESQTETKILKLHLLDLCGSCRIWLTIFGFASNVLSSDMAFLVAVPQAFDITTVFNTNRTLALN